MTDILHLSAGLGLQVFDWKDLFCFRVFTGEGLNLLSSLRGMEENLSFSYDLPKYLPVYDKHLPGPYGTEVVSYLPGFFPHQDEFK